MRESLILATKLFRQHKTKIIGFQLYYLKVLETQLLKSHQISLVNKHLLTDLNDLNEKLKQELNAKCDQISKIEAELIQLRIKVEKLDLDLSIEIDEKHALKSQLEDTNEQLYISNVTFSIKLTTVSLLIQTLPFFIQLNNKDLVEELKKYRSKKHINNFTQTIPNFNHKQVQTQLNIHNDRRELNKNCAYTTDGLLVNQINQDFLNEKARSIKRVRFSDFDYHQED